MEFMINIKVMWDFGSTISTQYMIWPYKGRVFSFSACATTNEIFLMGVTCLIYILVVIYLGMILDYRKFNYTLQGR